MGEVAELHSYGAGVRYERRPLPPGLARPW
jgi:hypothetical protein